MSAIASTESQSFIDELEAAIASGDAQRRVKMLERISDLFMAGSRYYADPQLALFDDVLMRLSAEIEIKARAKLAQAMADTDKALPRLIRSLAFDDAIEVAAPVLSRSSQLSDADLVENASTKSQDHLLAIARRLQLSELVTDVLVNRGDRRVLRTVAGNAGARLSLAGCDKLATHARSDLALARAMLRRSDLPRQFLLKLIENASAAVRAKLEADIPAVPSAVIAAVNDVATTMGQEARMASHRHVKASKDTRQRFSAQSITEVDVHAPAAAHRFDRTVVALARLGRFPIDLVERALLDEGADMILILAKAAGCTWTTTKALLHMYSAKRTLSAQDLDRAFGKFERLSPKTAQTVIAFHAKRQKPGAAKASTEVATEKKSPSDSLIAGEPPPAAA